MPLHPLPVRAFHRYVRRLVRAHFTAVHLHRTGAAPDPEREAVVFFANHTNWWDGFLAWLLGARLGLRFRVLMEARHLARYPFFRRIGALPLDRESAPGAWRDLEEARRGLEPGVGLWVFPQGSRRPAAEPVRGIERGIARLAVEARVPVRFVPVAFRYAWVGEQLPEAFVLVDESWVVGPGGTPERRAFAAEVEQRLAAAVARLDRLVTTERLDAFESLAEGRPSLNKRLDRVRHRLGLLRGPFEARNG